MSIGKIFIGTIDVASQLSDWKKAFAKLGIESLTVSHRKLHFAQKNDVDIDMSTLRRWNYRGVRPKALQSYLQTNWDLTIRKVLKRAIKECDTFMFVGSSFYNDSRDIKYLKNIGKKVIVYCIGDDVRWYTAMKQDFEKAKMEVPIYGDDYDYTLTRLKGILDYLRTAEKYCDVIFSAPNVAQLSLRPYFKSLIPLELSEFENTPFQRKEPIVVHAPSHLQFKGTAFIMEAIDKLEKEGIKFTKKLVSNMSNQEALEIYKNSDVIIGQLFCPGGGKLAHEGLAFGKVVLSKMGSEGEMYYENFPKDCPIIDVNKENIYDVLKSIVLDHPRRIELARKARPYIEKYNDNEVIAQGIVNALEGAKTQFQPSFFYENYKPVIKGEADLLNQYTSLIKDTDWYQKLYKPSYRDGLIF